jgi:probable HAF family extracellular repeat protein
MTSLLYRRPELENTLMTKYRTINCIVLMSALVIGMGIAVKAAALTLRFTITDLGTLGGPSSGGIGINASGQVTGEASTTELISHAFVWTPTTPNGASGVMHDLGTLGGTLSGGSGINAAGQVTGSSYTGEGASHAFFYDGTMHDLGTLGATYSEGHGVNDSGHVTGLFATPFNLSVHAFLDDGSMHDLGTFGGLYSQGYGINASGQVAGEYTAYFPGRGVENHAILWTPTTPNDASGTMQDLGTFGGTYSAGFGINDSGQVTGYAYATGDGEGYAFLYDGAMHSLGTLGGTYGAGNAINAAGDVVGDSDIAGDTVRHPFLYTSGSGMLDLNYLIDPRSGWDLRYAQAINDVRQITGSGYIGGEYHAYLLTPVPEPASLVLVALGLPFLVWRNSR